jgi:hypothetical protein
LVALLMLMFGGFQIRASTGRLIAEARRENVLELVLTAGLKPEEILQGLKHGQFALYRRLYAFCGLVFTLLMIAGVMLRPLNSLSLITYLTVWSWFFYGLYRTCNRLHGGNLWISLNLGRPPYSIAKLWLPSLGSFGYLGYHIYNNRSLGYPLWSPFPFGTMTEVVIVIFASLILMLCYYYGFGHYTEEMIASHLAEVASSPVPDPSDERIAKWDRSEPFPTPKDK